ncbi:MAG: hypothetical protein LKF52_13565 [Butyrivibrio sp.]|jgi:hypothetical protein|nr:hypothetical protein [Butyrivibrio sp.]
MQMKDRTDDELMRDWPAHYYEIEDIASREKCLQKILAESPESSADLRRLSLLRTRYGEQHETNRGDRFMGAWMMIKISGNTGISFLNRRRAEKELRKNLENLCILGSEPDEYLIREWQNFAECFLRSCTQCKTYGSTLFGMFPLKDRSVAAKIAGEIDLVTKVLPSAFGLENECAVFRNIMIEAYKNNLENGQEYWDSYCRSR